LWLDPNSREWLDWDIHYSLPIPKVFIWNYLDEMCLPYRKWVVNARLQGYCPFWPQHTKGMPFPDTKSQAGAWWQTNKWVVFMTHTVLSNKLLHCLMNQKSSPNGSSKCRIGHSGTLDLLANEGQQPDSSATTLAQHRFNG
jgi:hypothetical protein